MSRGMKRVCRVGVVASLLIVAVPWSGRDGARAQSDLDARAGKQLDSLVAIYKQLHANPELSTQEEQTSALIAKELRATGFEVTDHFGQYVLPETKAYGVVALLRNGPGPTVMVRTDMDALPIVENTGVPYASKVRVKRADGTEVGVMHACGHDVHMAVFVGVARLLVQTKDQWERDVGDDRAACGGSNWRSERDASCRAVYEIPQAAVRAGIARHERGADR